MAKSTTLNFTQNLNNISVQFNYADYLSIIQAVPATTGNNLNAPNVAVFQANTSLAGVSIPNVTPFVGSNVASWTINTIGVNASGNVSGQVAMSSFGAYLSIPGQGNVANVTSGGTSNATWNYYSGAIKPLYTASTNDAVVKAINVASTDTGARIITLWEQDVASNVMTQICGVNIPLNSGGTNGAISSIDLLGGSLIPSLPYDASGKRVFPLKAGTRLLVSVGQSSGVSTFPVVTAGCFISVHAMVEEY